MQEGATARRSEISPVTLALAAAGSIVATAAVSRFGLAGSLIGAGLAPIIVAVVKELGRKPIEGAASVGAARRVGRAPVGRRPAGAPAPRAGDPVPRPGRPTPITIHRTPRSRLRRVRWAAVALTSLVAFAIAVAAFTVPDLLKGSSIVSGRDTTFFGGSDPAPATPTPVDGSQEAPVEDVPADTEAPAVTAPDEAEEAPAEDAPAATAPAGPVAPDAAPPATPAP